MQPVIRDYLGRLDAAAAGLPFQRRAELVDEVRDHIELALSEAAEMDDATVLNVLDRLGSPDEIVAAEGDAGTPPPADRATPGPEIRIPRLTTEQRSIVLLTVGATLLPFIGSIAGVWVAAGSTQWTLRQKRTAALIVAILLVLPLTMTVPALISGEITWVFTSGGFVLPLIPLSGIVAALYLVVSTNLSVSVYWRQESAPGLDLDPVADAPHRDNRRPAGGLDLRAQAREVRLQPQQVRIGFRRPAGARQLEMRDEVAARAHERLEEAELRRRELQWHAADTSV